MSIALVNPSSFTPRQKARPAQVIHVVEQQVLPKLARMPATTSTTSVLELMRTDARTEVVLNTRIPSLLPPINAQPKEPTAIKPTPTSILQIPDVAAGTLDGTNLSFHRFGLSDLLLSWL